jgi:hypothetical protein
MFGIRLVCRDEMMFGCPLEQPPMTGRSILLYNHEAHSDLREPLFADRLRQDVRVSHCLACMHGDAVRSSRERVEPITSIKIGRHVLVGGVLMRLRRICRPTNGPVCLYERPGWECGIGRTTHHLAPR